MAAPIRYVANEALNAGIPFTNNGKNGTHLRPAKKLYDYGFSVGGPVWIPKIYQGKNRTFFYFNLERYRDRESLYNGIHTLPTDALRSGDLSAMLTGRVAGHRLRGPEHYGERDIRSGNHRYRFQRPPGAHRYSPTT